MLGLEDESDKAGGGSETNCRGEHEATLQRQRGRVLLWGMEEEPLLFEGSFGRSGAKDKARARP